MDPANVLIPLRGSHRQPLPLQVTTCSPAAAAVGAAALTEIARRLPHRCWLHTGQQRLQVQEGLHHATTLRGARLIRGADALTEGRSSPRRREVQASATGNDLLAFTVRS